MNFERALLLAVVGLVAVLAGYWVATHYFSSDAKVERRRRRSNAPVSSKRKGPMVKFSVRTPKEDKD